MPHKGKLTAVIQHRKIAESDAIREQNRVLGILNQRKLELESLRQKKQNIEHECLELEITLKKRALIAGDTSILLSSQELLCSKKNDLKRLEQEIKKQVESVNRANERLDYSNQELANARVEKKKVETIIKNREANAQLKIQAQEQDEFEDIFTKK